jgi:peptide/nickel transport system substrate-binding protein
MFAPAGKIRHAIARTLLILVVVIVILIIGVGGFIALSQVKSTTTSTTSSSQSSSQSPTTLSTSQSSSTTTPILTMTTSSSPTSSTTSTVATTSSSTATTGVATTSASNVVPNSTLTWETVSTPAVLDPGIGGLVYDLNIQQNVYEPLLWFNGSNSTSVIPWLAQNYTVAPNGLSVNFTLRQGITFADGEQLNSSAVYFSLNRLLIIDGTFGPFGHGVAQAWTIQKLLNTSLSSDLSGAQSYSPQWVSDVLAENFVQITGPYTFTLNLQSSSAALQILLASPWTAIIAPNYVMKNDISLWSQPSNNYSLPFPTLSGNSSEQFYQYYRDEAATCNAGVSPQGCAYTYLFGSYNGSLAGTGPYTIKSVGQSTNDIVLQANPNYWGGPYQAINGTKISPSISTITINYVPSVTTRELDLQNAAGAGKAFTIDLPGGNLYDIANRNAWLENGTLTSIEPGVSLYGPYSFFETNMIEFGMNITNQQTGNYYQFQPFADLRFRLAFADSVNISEVNVDVNNKLGVVASGAIPPGLPPAGSYNSSTATSYGYNLTAVQDYLLSAMEHPLTSFTFKNGTAAPAGTFNNTFGCVTLPASGTCTNPVPQTIEMYYGTGDTFSQTVMEDIASAINNVSATYNMGLTVDVVPLPSGQLTSLYEAGELQCFTTQWSFDYPWATDFLVGLYTPGGPSGSFGWNFTEMADLSNQMLKADSSNNVTGLIELTNAMNQFANSEVQYLWTVYPSLVTANSAIGVFTSNVHGYYFNPSLNGPYFAEMYVTG